MTSLRERLQDVEIAHRDGPLTERVAAAEHTESGRRETNLRRVVEAVGRYPGRTAMQLARGLDMSPYEVRRRLSDGKRLGTVRQGDAVHVGTDRLAVTWWPVEQQRRLEW
jgi:CRP-like cAMP-binding protein